MGTLSYLSESNFCDRVLNGGGNVGDVVFVDAEHGRHGSHLAGNERGQRLKTENKNEIFIF